MSHRLRRLPGIGLAVFRVLAVMAVNAGFLFAPTLHVQGGPGYSALRAGLSFAPTAGAFAAVSLTWRRWPAGLQRAMIPAGFALTALSVGVVGRAFHGGGDGGAGLYAGYAGPGIGLALAFSPPDAHRRARHRAARGRGGRQRLVSDGHPARSADRCGVFRHTVPERAESLGALRSYTSAEAFSVCAWALAGTAAAGAVSGLVLRRR
ncbi:hypothetical protein M878_30370 [Streptomyces roseochromogenus subsp. oscitans DS 12.976]|uniref:Uncharacterized protein n=1 Tax=Streptomyces roseochromogenus subsp. oscitans DS 12.976 TaxID=1352936 RepID=V6JZG4_STRRC|nr:hypothetical protein M878_30370 [Streptomyces roseochromogenus subsp. oscitans DS 12.976]